LVLEKLYTGVDADTGQIIGAQLTSKDVDDGSPVGSLLEQIAGTAASFTGDGAYDRDDVGERGSPTCDRACSWTLC
jgi:hypothetical protein